MGYLNYWWRLSATGAAFACFFFGGSLIAVTLLPILALLPGRRRERAQRAVRAICRFYVEMLQLTGLLRLRAEGFDELYAPGGRLIIANHPSLLDVVLLMALIPRAQCIVKHELWSHWLLGPLMRQAGYIRNDLDPASLMTACKAAVDGDGNLIIFPEGTRSQPGVPPRFRRGFARLATQTGGPIHVVVITCEPPTLIKGEPWWRIPARAPIFHLMLAARFEVGSYLRYPHSSLAARKLVQSLEAYYAGKLGNGGLRA